MTIISSLESFHYFLWFVCEQTSDDGESSEENAILLAFLYIFSAVLKTKALH